MIFNDTFGLRSAQKRQIIVAKKFLAIKNLFLEIIPWVLELKKNYGTLENQHLIFAQFS